MCRWIQSDSREEQTFDLEYSTGIRAESEELVRSGLESEVSHFGHGVDLSMPWLSHL